MNLIRFRKHSGKLILFCFVGVLAFLLDWLFFNLVYTITMWFTFSIFMGWVVSMIFNFTTNRNLTFKAGKKPLNRQLIKWLTVYFGVFLIRLLVSKGSLVLLGESEFNVNIAFFLGILVSIPFSFLGSLLWAFRK